MAETLLAPSDEDIRRSIEAMFFAYQGFTSDPDRILEERGYGRAHHRALHFINRHPNLTVNGLLAILGVRKQSLNRVLRALIADGLVDSEVGLQDRRERHLTLTKSGRSLEKALSTAQHRRMRAAFDGAGPAAVEGFLTVLEAMMDPEARTRYAALRDGSA
ncbi:MAG: MarR family transcriptional regulator [Pseudomonadota bacterium]